MTEPEPDYRVSDIMRTDAPVAAPTDSVASVARLMSEHRVVGVPVVDQDGDIVGIITEADFVAREADVTFPSILSLLGALIVIDAGRPFDEEMRQVLATTAEELMSSPVYNILSTATLTELATLMIQERVNPVPVVDDDLNFIGLVSRGDLVRFVARLEEAADLPAPSAETP